MALSYLEAETGESPEPKNWWQPWAKSCDLSQKEEKTQTNTKEGKKKKARLPMQTHQTYTLRVFHTQACKDSTPEGVLPPFHPPLWNSSSAEAGLARLNCIDQR